MGANLSIRVLTLLLTIMLAPGLSSANSLELEAVTRPSADIELAFVRPGKVAEVLVKEGDPVKAGQLLARQDDSAEQLQLQQLKAKARNRLRIEAAAADLRQKEEDLKKVEGAWKKGAATDWELEHSRLNVDIARLSLKLAQFEHDQDQIKYEELKTDLERLRLLSPVDGRVEEVLIEPGEAPQPLKPVLRIVKTDPLWIDVLAPLAAAKSLKPGGTGLVQFPAAGGAAPAAVVEGRISFVAAVSKAGSETLRVRLEVPNPGGRPAGERVVVRFPVAEIMATNPEPPAAREKLN